MLNVAVPKNALPRHAAYNGSHNKEWKLFKIRHRRNRSSPYQFAVEWFKMGGSFYHKVPRKNVFFLLTEPDEWIGFAATALDNTNLPKDPMKKWQSIYNVQRPVNKGPHKPKTTINLEEPNYRLCKPGDLSEHLSWLRIVTSTSVTLLFLALWEIYSAKDLDKYTHGRHVLGETSPINTTETVKTPVSTVRIPASTRQYIDTERDLLHVVREGSQIHCNMKKKQTKNKIFKKGPAAINFTLLINVVCQNGVGGPDPKRSPDSMRIHFSLGQNGQVNGYTKVVDKFGVPIAEEFFREVGKIAEFLCDGMQEIQKAVNKEPLFSDTARDLGFAALLRTLLHLSKNSSMGAELLVVCVMPLGPDVPRNIEHKDNINPPEYPYCKTGTFSAVVTNGEGRLFLFQLIVAGRNYAPGVSKDDKGYKYIR